jgi:hypothetical protein
MPMPSEGKPLPSGSGKPAIPSLTVSLVQVKSPRARSPVGTTAQSTAIATRAASAA